MIDLLRFESTLGAALESVRRARSRRQRHAALDEAEVALLEVLGVLHGQTPDRAREAAAAAIAAARLRDEAEPGQHGARLPRHRACFATQESV